MVVPGSLSCLGFFHCHHSNDCLAGSSGTPVLNRGMRRKWYFPADGLYQLQLQVQCLLWERNHTLIIRHIYTATLVHLRLSSLTRHDNSAYLKAIKPMISALFTLHLENISHVVWVRRALNLNSESYQSVPLTSLRATVSTQWEWPWEVTHCTSQGTGVVGQDGTLENVLSTCFIS